MNCKIIQDLLPSYCDKLTSDESNQEIETHLEECEECKTVYEDMCNNTQLDVEVQDKDIKPLQKIKRSIRFKTIIGFCVGVLVCFGIFMFVFYGVVPISSSKLNMQMLVDEEDNLNILFMGKCQAIRESSDSQYIFDEDGGVVTINRHITIYPVINPFVEEGFHANEFDFTTLTKYGGTITIHCRDKDIVYDVKELVEQLKEK